MKVVCQKCGAAYAINEAAIPPKGARAQCPRCKALQAVMRPEGPEGPGIAPPPPTPVFALPAAPPPLPSAGAAPPPPPPLPSRRAPAPADDPFANLNFAAAPPPPAPPSALAPPPREAAPADPFAGLDFGAPPPPPAPPPLAASATPAPAPMPVPMNGASALASPERPNSDPFANLDLGESPPPSAPPPPDPFAGQPSPATPPAGGAPQAPLGKCRSCGKEIYDPFDAALGTCESCRAKEMAAPPGNAAGRAGPEPGAPRDLQPPPPDAAEDEKPLEIARPSPSRPPTSVASARVPTNPGPLTPRRRTSGLQVAVVVAVVVAVGGGLAGYRFMPGLFGPRAPPEVPVPEAIAKALTGWRLAHPNPQGSTAEHLLHGRDHIDLDRAGDYRIAEEDFKEAALMAGKDRRLLAEAVAGMVEADALRNTDLHDTTGIEERRSLLEAAAQLAPGLDGVLRARVYLALWEGGPSSLEVARKNAKAAFDAAGPATKGDALLAQGCAFLDSAQMAYEFLDKALQSNPKLLRAYYYRGLAAERVGHYTAAKRDFQKRLALDPDAIRARIEIGRLDAEVGEIAQAKKDLQKQGEPVSPEARLLQAQIEMQVEHANSAAESDVEEVLDSDPPAPKLVQAGALVAGAALSREKGDFTSARSRLDKAVKLLPDYPPALFQRVLVAIASNHAADGDAPLAQLLAANPDGVRLDVLKGRVAFLEGRGDESVLDFRTALQKNSQDLHAALLGAALASAAGKSDASYELMSKGLEIDPASDTHHRNLTDFYESTRSELAATAGGFEKEDRVLAQPQIYAGILHYFRGDVAGAERFLNDALKIEPGSASALSYLAQISMDRKKYPRAQELASQGLESERLSVLAKFLLAEAYEAQGKLEEARRLYGELITQAPSFNGAVLREGELMVKMGKADGAEELLLKLLFADPDDSDAKQTLFKLGY